MTIYLFGDSYVENESIDKHQYLGIEDHKRWYDLLSEEQDEKNINYGKCGTGPIQAMSNFQECLEKGLLNNEKVVMVLSHPMRIPWKIEMMNLNEKTDPAGCFITYFTDSDNIEPKLRNSIKDLYDCMWEELSRSNYKNVCYLSHMSKVHSIKMIVFTVYHVQEFNDICQGRYPQINTSDLIYDLVSLNTDNFYFHNIPLFDISRYEETDDSCLMNHFSKYNHTILSNVISNFFYNTNYDTKFFKSTDKYDKDHIDFIYE